MLFYHLTRLTNHTTFVLQKYKLYHNETEE